MMTERLKYNKTHDKFLSAYYWRLKSGAEIDYVEEYGGELYPYEFKLSKDFAGSGANIFKGYYGAYPQVVNKQNFTDWLLK